MDDFSSEIVGKNTTDNMECVGPFGMSSRIQRGKRILDFAKENTSSNNQFILPKGNKQVLDMGNSRERDKKIRLTL